MSETIKLIVIGKPEPRGSKVAIPLYDPLLDEDGKVVLDPITGKRKMKPRVDKYGRVVLFAKDDNPASGPWMKKVAKAARDRMQNRAPVRCAVKLNLRFFVDRPLFHFGTGRNAGILKDKFARVRPVVRPDRLKLARAVEDAVTGIFYMDDSQTVGGNVEKFYVGPEEQPRVEIEMELPNVVEQHNVQRSLIEQ